MNHDPYDHLRNKEKLETYIQYAYDNKKGIYSIVPEKTLEQTQREAQGMKEEFDRVISIEKERMKIIAQEENARVMEILREKQADLTCPLCIEEMPAVFSPDQSPLMMGCCGVRICRSCTPEWASRQDLTKEVICFSCRRAVNRASFKDLFLNGNDNAKGLAKVNLAITQHSCGEYQKSYEYYEEAAEIGYAGAYASLAGFHFYGDNDFKVEKSIEKAKELAQRGADQGHMLSNFLLSKIHQQEGNHFDYFRLLSLAAYQGDTDAMEELSGYYRENIYAKNNLILTLYWIGKVVEDEDANEECYERFLIYLETFMRGLHKHSFFDIEPLTGFSHIPLCKLVRRRMGKRHCTGEYDVVVNMEHSVWNEICVNCGNRAKEKLKKCSNCKSYSYCSKSCQVKHRKDGHRSDCKGSHWLDEIFPNIRDPRSMSSNGCRILTKAFFDNDTSDPIDVWKDFVWSVLL